MYADAVLRLCASMAAVVGWQCRAIRDADRVVCLRYCSSGHHQHSQLAPRSFRPGPTETSPFPRAPTKSHTLTQARNDRPKRVNYCRPLPAEFTLRPVYSLDFDPSTWLKVPPHCPISSVQVEYSYL
jgi:hypothetical protein